MRIDVLTPAKSTALLTLAAVKDRLRIKTSSQDAILSALIKGVSAAAVQAIGRDLVAQLYRVAQTGSCRDRLILPRRPIDSATLSVSIDGTDLSLDTDYTVDSAARGILYRSSLWPAKNRFPGMEGESNIESSFWAGYVPPTVVSDWAVGAVEAGDWIRPTNPAATPLRFRVPEGGTLAGEEPDWSAAVAGVEFDAGGVTVIPHELPEIPEDLLEGAEFAVQTWFRMQDSPVMQGVQAERRGSHELSYVAAPYFFQDALPKPTLALWGAHSC